MNSEKPKCPRCEPKGLKYGVTEGMVSSTLMNISEAYWDEDGTYHPPEDPNYEIREYHCSHGCHWQEDPNGARLLDQTMAYTRTNMGDWVAFPREDSSREAGE